VPPHGGKLQTISNPKKMKMIGETIRTEFEALKNDFETIRQQIKKENEQDNDMGRSIRFRS